MMLKVAFFLSSIASSAGAELSLKPEARAALMARARRLSGDKNNQNQKEYHFLADYNIRFESCASLPNFERQGMRNQALIKFKLCPTKDANGDDATCSSSCNGPEYLVEGKQFLYYVIAAKCDATEATCENFCYNNAGNYYNEEYCMNACYENYGMSDCANFQQDDNGDKEGGDEAFECRNEYGDSHDQDREYYNFGYHTGAYCAEGGNAVYLGTFSDKSCTELADEGTYKNYYGKSQPWSTTPIISSYEDCIVCKDSENSDEYDSYAIKSCSYIYGESGKCEKDYVPNGVYYPDISACSFISNTYPQLSSSMSSTSANSSTSVKSKAKRSSSRGHGAATFFAWFWFLCTCGLAYLIIMWQRKKKAALSLQSGGGALA